MNIDITKTPPPVVLSENDILFEVLSNNYLDNSGQLAQLNITFPSLPETGDSFTIECDLFTQTFTFVSSPDDSGNQLRTTDVDYLTLKILLIEDMAKNYYIGKYFIVGFIPNDKTLELRANSLFALPDANITFDFANSSPTWTGFTGIAPAYLQNYRLQAMIDIIGIEESLVPSKDTQKALFNFKGLFDLSGGFTWPVTGVGITSFPDMTDEFEFSAWSLHDGSYTARHYEGPFNVLLGGISKKDAKALTDDDSEWFTKQQSDKHPLTWQPQGHLIDLNSILKLYYLNVSGSSSLRDVKLQVTYTTSEGSFDLPDQVFSDLKDFWVYEIDISPAFLLSSLGAAVNNVQHFSVAVKDYNTDELLLAKRRYYFDWRYQPYRREFIFSNSYIGAYDTIRFTGQAELSWENDTYTTEQRVYDDQLKQIRQARGELSDTFTVSTGWISKAVLDYLEEFILSEDRYEIINDKLYPVFITSSKIAHRVDGDYNYQVEFEMKRSFTESYHSAVFADESGQAPSGGDVNTPSPAATGGHTIIAPDGSTMPQRKKLKFVGADVTDDEANDQTIITVQASATDTDSEPADKLYMFNNY